jgi:hypothetical protein
MPARGFLSIWSVEDIDAAFRLLSLKARPAMDKDPLAARGGEIITDRSATDRPDDLQLHPPLHRSWLPPRQPIRRKAEL